jgi:hydroxymethylbilane synthase
MAVAGLVRLGLHGSLTEILDTGLMMPAVGQGALALEIREDNGHVRELLDRITCHEDFMALRAERALLENLEGGCLVPLGGLAMVQEGVIHLHGVIAAPDGSVRFSFSGSGPLGSPEELGRRVAGGLIGLGGAKILEEIRKSHE